MRVLVPVPRHETAQDFTRVRRVLANDRLNQGVGFLGREIAVVFVGVDSDGKPRAITFGMKLCRVDIFAHAEHLHRAGFVAEQQHGTLRQAIASFLVSAQHRDLCGKVSQQIIAAAIIGYADDGAAHGFAVLLRDRRSEIRAEQAATGASPEERKILRDDGVEQMLEISFDLDLDGLLLLLRCTDVERCCGVLMSNGLPPTITAA